MTIKDRGIIKFLPASFLPELNNNIKKIIDEQEFIPNPELDEQHLEFLDNKICEAMELNAEVSITHYNNQRYELIVGHIHYMDPYKKSIKIVDKFHEWMEIKLGYIIDIQ
ncbi:YolD-like family protein [Neobacillus notoginsengisoli]|uniref:YolD-like family protein n=1 Tax=Neobacillus notoginsengisoli TaxID=1578198 RepID=A0A417YQK7_9BACI|nr:YolD-like family protein [Neobacillus notoginsengisoli]RHW36006.1 YolD-like family protein [Neobacillus notoginsengisoli]